MLTTPKHLPPRDAWALAVVLMAAMTFSHLDRALLGLLADPIKESLSLTDSNIGLLHAAYGILSGFAAFPLARWIDRGPRRLIVGLGILAWTGATAATAAATSFLQLLGARAITSVGEAALMPGATSLISDAFPAEKRATPMGVFTIGIYFGSAAALIGGGALAHAFATGALPLPPFVATSWQAVFLVIGLAGMLVAPALALTKSPARNADAQEREAASIAAVLGFCRANPQLLVGHIVGFTMMGFAANAVGMWVPSLFSREFGWSSAQLGLAFGLVLLGVGPLGSVTGGLLADRLMQGGRKDASIRVGLISGYIAAPAAACAGLAANGVICMLALAVFFFVISFNWALAATSLAAVTPSAMRAQMIAVYLGVSNVIGGGVGPLVLAMASDALSQSGGGLQQAVLFVTPTAVALGVLFLHVARPRFATQTMS